jgi:PII-like signaling protein
LGIRLLKQYVACIPEVTDDDENISRAIEKFYEILEKNQVILNDHQDDET